MAINENKDVLNYFRLYYKPPLVMGHLSEYQAILGSSQELNGLSSSSLLKCLKKN